MFRFLCWLCLVLFTNCAASQQPIFQWAAQFGSSDINDTWYDNARSVAVDQQGNVYSVGLFFHDVDFDPGPGTSAMTAQGPFDEAIYISKLSPTGQFIWAEQIPTEVEGPIYVNVDHHNNVYVTSYVSSSIDMDPGSGIYNSNMVGVHDAFLLKLDPNGNLLWEKQFGAAGSTNGASGYAVDVDANDNVILTGSFYGTIDLDPGTGTSLVTGVGSATVFIVKLDSNGNFIWGRQVGGTGSIYGYVDAEDIKCDGSGNIFTTGWFNGNCDFDVGRTGTSLTSGGPSDGFILKLDGNGNFQWVKKIGNSAANLVVQPRGIDVDQSGNVYSAGSFLGTQDFDPGTSSFNLVSNGSFDSYLLKLSADGNFIWAKNIGGNDVDYGYDLSVGTNGGVYLIGLYSGTIDFDPGTQASLIYGLYDWTVLSKFDADGNFKYAAPFSGYNTGRRIVTDPAENIYVTGGFGGTVDFDPGPGVFNLSEGRGWTDAYLVKLSRCQNLTMSTLEISTCEGYTLNGHSYDSSGSYLQVIPNSTGCDSVITLNLTINKKRTSQTKSICEGQSFYTGGANQTETGIYIDTLKTVSGCDSIVTTNLIVNNKPAPDLGKDQYLCDGSSLTITPGTFSSYIWQDGTSQTNFTLNTGGVYFVTVTNNRNCSASDTININVVQPPQDFLKTIDSLCSYDDLTLRPLKSFNSYQWSTGSTQSNITVQAPGLYWLKVYDLHGCSGIDTITVIPKQCMHGVYVPTAFTPNKDGKNDLFKPLVFGKINKYQFTIYNRWGQAVFQTTQINKGWDGASGSIDQQSNVFVWICSWQFEGEDAKSKKGTVILIR